MTTPTPVFSFREYPSGHVGCPNSTF